MRDLFILPLNIQLIATLADVIKRHDKQSRVHILSVTISYAGAIVTFYKSIFGMSFIFSHSICIRTHFLCRSSLSHHLQTGSDKSLFADGSYCLKFLLCMQKLLVNFMILLPQVLTDKNN